MKNQDVFDTLRSCVDRSGEFLVNAPWENKDFYAAWLAQASFYIQHSTRLLALTGAKMPLSDNANHNVFLKHCAEEKGHENLPINDIKAIGKSFNDYPEFSCTKAFYQTQYYAIEHISPYSFFAYTLFLETLACDYGPIIQKKIESIYGPKAVSFLRVHSDADIEHVREGMERVQKLAAHHPAIEEHIHLCAYLYDQLCLESLKISGAKYKAAA